MCRPDFPAHRKTWNTTFSVFYHMVEEALARLSQIWATWAATERPCNGRPIASRLAGKWLIQSGRSKAFEPQAPDLIPSF
jgi:hypothetical protein